jgi:glutamyl/glutaminyl-tRNA synthetase
VLAPIIDGSFPIDENSMKKVQSIPKIKNHLQSLTDRFTTINEWTVDNIKNNLTQHAAEIDQKLGKIMLPLRVCTTGVGQGTDLIPTLEGIGKEATIQRIKNRLNIIFSNE